MTILLIAIGYFLGSFPSGYVICRALNGLNIMEHGSGNTGATNVFRVCGLKSGVIVALLDVAKGFIAVYLGIRVGGEALGLLAGIAAVVGHTWSVFLKFKGGKGIATTGGVLLGLMPPLVAILLLVWAAITFSTGYVSLASVTIALLFPVLVLLFGYPSSYFYASLIIAAIAIIRHRGNIQRLLRGEENRFGKRGLKRPRP